MNPYRRGPLTAREAGLGVFAALCAVLLVWMWLGAPWWLW